MTTKLFQKVFAAVVLLASTVMVSAQSEEPKTLYIIKDQTIIYSIPVADLDSIIFYNPLKEACAAKTHPDSTFMWDNPTNKCIGNYI